MSGDSKRAFTLLEIATRETSNENEALSAARQLGKMARGVGGVETLFGPRPNPSRIPLQSFNAARRADQEMVREREEAKARIADLEAQVSRLTMQKNALETEVENLKAALRDRPLKHRDGTMPFRDFSHKVQTLLGDTKWRQEFSHQTGVDANAINRAAVSGVVPSEWVEMLSRLKLPRKATERKAAFSPDEVKAIRGWADTMNDEDIARKATLEFSRFITQNAIKKLRTDLRGGNRRYSDSAYGGPLPIANSTRNSNFPWVRFPEIELRVCQNYLKTNRRSAAELAKEITEETGIQVNEGTIKQRCDNAPPPAVMLKGITEKGPLTSIELWYQGSSIRKRAWKSMAFEIMQVPSRTIYAPLDDIPSEAVDRLREAGRMARAQKGEG